jgi:hypothetical protein
MHIPSQLESALVLQLRSPIAWAASVEAPASGTLTPVDAEAPFNPHDYLQRDRELQFRDLTVGAAILSTSIQVSNVYLHATDQPKLQGPVFPTLPLAASEITSTGSNLSMVRHVHNASIPLDAARFADSDLYGRDALIYEVIARACAASFLHPPIVPMDSTGTLISLNGSSAWSLAEGEPEPADLNAAMTLNRDAFKKADQHLADRDNQLAAYASRLAQVLKNPFAYAMRLYVRVDGPNPYEPETYVLISDDETERVWKAEPALNDRFKIVYNKADSTLQWFREQTDEIHVPQLYAMTIPGIEPNQVLTTLPEVPDPQDCQYWRHKAGQVVPEGVSYTDALALDWTAGSDYTGGAVGGIVQPDGVSLTVPGAIDFVIPGVVTGKPFNTAYAQNYRVAVLAQPNSLIEVTGGQNISSTNGTLGGATFELNVVTVGAKEYLVSSGDGIIYNGGTYVPGETFQGVASVTTYSQVSLAFPSTVRQQSCYWNMALPPGAWGLRLQYTNLSGVTSGFGVAVKYSNGASLVDVIQDAAVLPFTETNGVLVETEPSFFQVPNTANSTIGVFWNYGDGEFQVRKLILESESISTGSYAIECLLADGTASVNVSGFNKLTEAMLWELPVTGTHSADVRLKWSDSPSCPVRLKQVQIQVAGSYATTPNSFLFGGWRQECLDRAERVIQRGYAATVESYGTNIETQCPDNVIVVGQVWDRTTHGAWMGLVEVKNPRLREMDTISVITPGRQYEVTSGSVLYDGSYYDVGSKFYGTVAGGDSYTGGLVKQVGALMKARTGHVGMPCLMPDGLVMDSSGVVRMQNTLGFAMPRFVALAAWMIELGAYVVQDEFWMSDFYDRFDTDVRSEAERVLIQTAVSPANAGVVTTGGMTRVGTTLALTTTPNTDPDYTFTFVNWTDSTGAVVSTSASWSVLVTEPQTYTANYSVAAAMYLVSTAISPVGGGTVVGGGLYPYGTLLSLTAVPTGGVISGDVGADIVIVLDESVSMGTERVWVKTMVQDLNDNLKANGIGTATVLNRFGLVGFGGNAAPYIRGHVHLIGGQPFVEADLADVWLTAWNTAVDSVAAHDGGGTEDGYEALNVALAYTWRTTSVGKVIILLTDEARNTSSGSTGNVDNVLRDSIAASLAAGEYIAAAGLNLKLRDAAGGAEININTPPLPYPFNAGQDYCVLGPTIGFGWDDATATINGLSYRKSGLSFVTGTGGLDGTTSSYALSYIFAWNTAGYSPSKLRTTYRDLFISTTVRGSLWDLSYLRTLQFSADPQYADALTEAFVEHIKDRVLASFSWTFVNWTGAVTSTSNPLAYTVVGPASLTANFILA